MLNKEVFVVLCCAVIAMQTLVYRDALAVRKQYKIYIMFVLLYTEAYKFNGLVYYDCVHVFMASSIFATISVKCTR